ncbi:hypothetical protein [Candidatus Lokiarchaeum ossiferum]|uniref:hypothetical protein n=1 Tax=Candidatus Lokiarchaeum ossiferum TaxID=2951803 RepID=UPI00352C20D6
MTRVIKPEELRILLFIRYCGRKKKDIYEFSAKSHFQKWYYLSRNPNLLEIFLEKYGFTGKLKGKPNPSALFIRNVRGQVLRREKKKADDINEALATLKSCKLLDKTTKKRTIIYSLTEASISYLEEMKSSSQETQDYMQILFIIKEYIDKIDFKDVLHYINNLARKYKKPRGLIVKGKGKKVLVRTPQKNSKI